MKKYLREIKHMLINEKYPTGTSQRQRLLAMQENASLTNGYGYWDIDSPGERSPTPDMKNTKKVGRRLMLNDMVA
jgi:carnitine O-acetyltransferase